MTVLQVTSCGRRIDLAIAQDLSLTLNDEGMSDSISVPVCDGSLTVASAYFSQIDPISLFQSGEVGAWFDPSDFSTMRQTSNGATPVTAVGDAVGLILDKSQGLALGAEKLSNPDFTSNVTGWTIATANATLAWDADDGGSALVNVTGVGGGIADSQVMSLTAGKVYEVSVRVKLGTYSGVLLLNADGSPVVFTPTTSYQTFTRLVVPAGADMLVSISRGSTATGTFYVSSFSVKEVAGNHASQATPTSRPILRQDSSGRYYLEFDGVDDRMTTASFSPGTDKVQAFAGVRKSSDALATAVFEFSPQTALNAGSTALLAPSANATANYQFRSRGSAAVVSVAAATYAAPITNVVCGLGDISGDSNIIRVNGTQVNSASTDQGTGNYLTYSLNIGARAGSSLFFNGSLYSLIIRFSATNLEPILIPSVENWMNGKTGAY